MRVLRVLPAAVCLLAGACASSNSTEQEQSNVTAISISDFTFTPATASVPVGSTVRWSNAGPSEHSSTSDASVWDSGVLAPLPAGGGGGYGGGGTGGGGTGGGGTGGGGTGGGGYGGGGMGGGYGRAGYVVASATGYAFTFTEPGTYGFHCSVHPPATNPAFVGTITVTPP